MPGKGKSVLHSKYGACSGRKKLKKCNNNGEADNAVVIDVDSDNIHNVIIIDVPESLKGKLQGSSVLGKDKSRPLRTICIDDDESSDVSSSGRLFPAYSNERNSVNAVGDDCQFFPEKFSPLNLSKRKRTYSGEASVGKRYGDSDSSDYDSSDCEFMGDSFGKLREQWEKANMKKSVVHNGQSGRDDHVSTPELRNGAQHEVEVENTANQCTEANVPVSCNASFFERNPSPFSQTGVENSGSRSRNSSYGDEQGSKQVNYTNNKEKTQLAESCMPNAEPTTDTIFGCSKANLPGEEGSYFRTQLSVETEVGGGGRQNIQRSPSFDSDLSNEFKSGSSTSPDKEKPVDEEPSFHSIRLLDETQDKSGVMDNAIGTVPGGTYCEDPPLRKAGSENGKGCCHEKTQNGRKMGTRELSGELLSNHQYDEQDGSFHGEDGDAVIAVDCCIITEREKLKETDEYKRAVEEEWASRQRELQLQAEEAQRLRLLRKRMKSERMRLLDMERRQQQRVEEIREVQKQDEEKMNLKEKVRAEVRKELNQLEIWCRDMASLLRSLGIHVGGRFHSPLHEVRAAYKQALLRFHPDRASGSDIRQLVEAEEKFKLISRMKEKFLS